MEPFLPMLVTEAVGAATMAGLKMYLEHRAISRTNSRDNSRERGIQRAVETEQEEEQEIHLADIHNDDRAPDLEDMVYGTRRKNRVVMGFNSMKKGVMDLYKTATRSRDCTPLRVRLAEPDVIPPAAEITPTKPKMKREVCGLYGVKYLE